MDTTALYVTEIDGTQVVATAHCYFAQAPCEPVLRTLQIFDTR